MKLAWNLALRDLRGGLGGLRLLAICLFLGVAALAGVGSLSSAILGELSANGRTILGGDVEMRVTQRLAGPAERAAFAAAGRLSETIRMRAMASRPDGSAAVLAELKGVDAAYPLYGKLRMAPGALAPRPTGTGVAIAPALAQRLSVKVGDRIRIGDALLTVTGIIAEEPDRTGEGFTFGPAALVDQAGLAATGLVQPGSLYNTRYRLRLPPNANADATGKALAARFPTGGWEVRDRDNGAPGVSRFIGRLGQFLSLIGLAALAVAGIGVGNGVAAYLDGKRTALATLKVLGASSRTIFLSCLFQIGMVAAGAIAAGLIVGALVPPLVTALAGDGLAVKPNLSLHPLPLLLAAIYGLLIALLFTLAPLARARAVTAATLFRGDVGNGGRPSPAMLATTIGTAAAIALLATFTARDPWLAAGFIAGVFGLLVLLAGLGTAIRALAARIPRPRTPIARLALANLHRPGAQTARLVVALGLGLTLFATLAIVETSLANQLRSSIPARAPSFFVLDIPTGEVARFTATVARATPGARVDTVPSLRGSLVSYGKTRVGDAHKGPETLILRGDRGLTFSTGIPEGNRVVAGKWWPANYAGPPLVSLDVEAARDLNIGVGDPITVSVLGVEISATVASLREIDWDTLGFNFLMVFSPGTFEGAPFTYMATIAAPLAAEADLSRAVTGAFPSVSMIRVKEIIDQVGTLFAQLGTAVSAAGGVAVAAGIAVLVGAVAASRRARIYDAVLLKLLGATRPQILLVQALEYGALALILTLVALGIGSGAGWYVVTRIFELEWAPDWGAVAITLAAGALGTLAIGLIGALPALAARPARALRAL